MVAWRKHRLPRHARFSGSGEQADPDEIDAFWTDERLDRAQPMEMPTVDPAYQARLAALDRRLRWLPDGPRYRARAGMLRQLTRLKRRQGPGAVRCTDYPRRVPTTDLYALASLGRHGCIEIPVAIWGAPGGLG